MESEFLTAEAAAAFGSVAPAAAFGSVPLTAEAVICARRWLLSAPLSATLLAASSACRKAIYVIAR
jgi:hypothetical protein